MLYHRCDRFTSGRLAIGILCAFTLTAAPADPPDWAPAHGYRDKHKHHEERDDDEHHAPRVEEVDFAHNRYGVLDGHCNRDGIGSVLGGAVGGVVGGVVGNQASQGDPMATAVGTLIGSVFGSTIGASMDAADRACTHQVLQYAHDNVPVRWQNGPTAYVVTPLAVIQQGERRCRDFVVTLVRDGHEHQTDRKSVV